jgi:hypothetical protein
MSRSTLAVAAALALVVSAVAFALGRGASAEPNPNNPRARIVYLYVSGSGPQAKAWYDGAPPSGVAVQSALDRFVADGFRYAAISSSGRTPSVGGTSQPRADEIAADYVVLLER